MEEGSPRERELLETLRGLRREGRLEGEAPEEYRIVAELGRGGQGVVFEAVERASGRRVALKQLVEPERATRERLLRFEREARLVQALDHPGIVRWLARGELSGGRPWFAMELVEGSSIDAWVAAADAGVGRVLELVRGVAEAVGAAHRSGVVHRDLKPSNVLVDREGRPRVLDFGLGKLLPAEVEADLTQATPEQSLTRSGGLVGSLRWMAPEQLRDPSSASRAADVYALGLLLATLLAGAAPFADRSSFVDLVDAIEHETPIPERDRRGRRLPRGLRAVLGRALERDPNRRYPEAAALAEDLARLERGQRPEALPLVPRPTRRTVLQAAAGVGLMGGAIGLRRIVGARVEAAPGPEAGLLEIEQYRWRKALARLRDGATGADVASMGDLFDPAAYWPLAGFYLSFPLEAAVLHGQAEAVVAAKLWRHRTGVWLQPGGGQTVERWAVPGLERLRGIRVGPGGRIEPSPDGSKFLAREGEHWRLRNAGVDEGGGPLPSVELRTLGEVDYACFGPDETIVCLRRLDGEVVRLSLETVSTGEVVYSRDLALALRVGRDEDLRADVTPDAALLISSQMNLGRGRPAARLVVFPREDTVRPWPVEIEDLKVLGQLSADRWLAFGSGEPMSIIDLSSGATTAFEERPEGAAPVTPPFFDERDGRTYGRDDRSGAIDRHAIGNWIQPLEPWQSLSGVASHIAPAVHGDGVTIVDDRWISFWHPDPVGLERDAGQTGVASHQLQVALTPDGDRWACAAKEGTLHGRWGVDGAELIPSSGPDDFPRSVAFDPSDPERVAIGAESGHVQIVDLVTARVVREWAAPVQADGDARGVNQVAFAADGSGLACAFENGVVRVVDPRSGDVVFERWAAPGRRPIPWSSVAWGVGGHWLVAAGWGGHVWWLDRAGEGEPGSIGDLAAFESRSRFRSIDVDSRGDLVVLSMRDGRLFFLRPGEHRPERVVDVDELDTFTARFDPSGSALLVAGSLGMLVILDAATGEELGRTRTAAEAIFDLRLDATGRRLILGSSSAEPLRVDLGDLDPLLARRALNLGDALDGLGRPAAVERLRRTALSIVGAG